MESGIHCVYWFLSLANHLQLLHRVFASSGVSETSFQQCFKLCPIISWAEVLFSFVIVNKGILPDFGGACGH